MDWDQLSGSNCPAYHTRAMVRWRSFAFAVCSTVIRLTNVCSMMTMGKNGKINSGTCQLDAGYIAWSYSAPSWMVDPEELVASSDWWVDANPDLAWVFLFLYWKWETPCISRNTSLCRSRMIMQWAAGNQMAPQWISCFRINLTMSTSRNLSLGESGAGQQSRLLRSTPCCIPESRGD